MTTALEQAMQQQIDFFKQFNFPTPDLKIPDADGPSFTSNDYLALSSNPEIRRMFLDRLAQHELILGSRAARHGGGNTSDHVRVEERLAKFFNGPSALFFNSGLDANHGLWSTLPQADDVIVYDECVHASMHDGMRMSKARHALHAFKHNSVSDLRKKLQDIMRSTPSVRDGRSSVFVLVDALYSLDGDFAPLQDICTAVEEILPEGSGYVFADEAHSTGVIGEHGRGVTCHLGLEDRVLIRLHTFGKAWGCSGAVLVCPPLMRHYLIYTCRSFIFTTATPRYNLFNIECVLDYMESDKGRQIVAREQVLIAHARSGFAREFHGMDHDIANMPVGEHASVAGYLSPVLPIFSSNAAGLAECLTRHGFTMRHAVFPLVPVGTERIRLALQASNTFEEIDDLVGIVGRWVKGEQSKRIAYDSEMIKAKL